MTRCYSKKEVISRYLQTRRPHVRATSIKFRMARKEMKYLMGGGNLYLVMKNFTSNSKVKFRNQFCCELRSYSMSLDAQKD